MGRRRSRARPGRRKLLRCTRCGNTKGMFHNDRLCVTCEAKMEARKELFANSEKKEEKKMHIPTMSK